MSPQALIKGIVSQLLPQALLDGPESEGAPRLMRYRELAISFLQSTKHPNTREGTYFVIGNPAEGTGVAGAVLAAFANTTAAFVIQNTQDPNNPASKSIDLDFLKLLYTVAPASATAMRYAIAIDDVSRVPTGGFQKLVGSAGTGSANPPGPVINSSIANVWCFSAAFMTVPAPGAQVRYVARGAIAGLPVVGTEHLVRFGPDGVGSSMSTIDAPVTIPPGKWCVVHLWWPGNAATGPSMEFSLGQMER